MKDKIFKNGNTQALFLHFAYLTRVSNIIYKQPERNLYKDHTDFIENGGGYKLASECFEDAILIHGLRYHAWKIIDELEKVFGEDLKGMTYQEIIDFETEIKKDKNEGEDI